jgi:hypothetical protein
MLLGMTIKGQLGANEPERSGPLGSERHFGWQDMFVGRDADRAASVASSYTTATSAL